MAPSFLTLGTREASLVLECRDSMPPLWRHFGAGVDSRCLQPLGKQRSPASFSLDNDVPLSLAPVNGAGWFGPAALSVRVDGPANVVVFDDVEVDQAGESLRVTSRDGRTGVVLEQRISLADGGAFRFGATVRNEGDGPHSLDWLASALVPLPASSASLVSWRGRHNAELVECVEPMPLHAWAREGRRGISGHGGPPALVVLGPGATRDAGLVHATQLAWSGDSRIAVERDDEGCWTLSLGVALRPGEVVLQPGEAWTAPDALIAVSTRGRNGASALQHEAVRGLVRWPGGAMRARPVHLNSWEACYFRHDTDRIVQLAESAAAAGVERFVLDDGWFRNRDDDTAGLGDWTADPRKYPEGLGALAAKVTALGMEFGLWVEPEMISPDSDLYRAHPDWALAAEGRARPTARNQLVLDMGRADVREYLFAAIDTLLRELSVGYLKWDHNRDLAPAGGERQVRGTYELLARLRAAHPGVEIEGCAGGGGRSDAGLAPYVHRFWTSDNIDAVSRVPIQRGFLAFLPPEMMGAHIGASPAHATGRRQSMPFRAAVAMPGHLGVELDPGKLSEAERDELADWIGFHKQWRDVLHAGHVWLGEGADGLVWQAQGRADEFLLFAIRRDPAQDRHPQPLPLPFLAGEGAAEVQLLRIAGGDGPHQPPSASLFDDMRAAPVRFDRSWLAHAGLPLPPMKAETVAIFQVRTPA
ncbi:MAG: alpha-galactosidase [Sphingomonadales bacterium]|nr:alpha-galactosidase [Sphingomonadales bacterium]MDE2569136.1 alpha-galactosidase [Sphingomonadales bacterium]